jgi:cytochrome b561/polyisoprenoid-binding protein YceI
VERTDYTAVAKTFHWLIALVIFVQFPLAWIMDDLPLIQKIQAYNLHKSLGLTVLALMVLRLFWRLLVKAPSLPVAMPAYERAAAKLGHLGLYAVIFLMTLTGWAMISASDRPSVLFQLTKFPLLPWLSSLPAAEKKEYAEAFAQAHGLLGYALLALIAVHLAATLRHAVILRDGILSRMLPRFAGKAALTVIGIATAGLIALGCAGQAKAAEWSVKPEQSSVSFEATGSGYTTKGGFGKYKAEVEFDADTPAETAIKVQIDISSIATGNGEVDDALKTADFFDPKQFPAAQFTARGAKQTGEGKYVLDGRLTLKGVTKPISLPFSISIKDGTATVTAETKVNRLDFGVGPETIAGLAIDKDVKLTINLTAVRLDN